MQHLWDPMVGIPTPPKRGCGQLSYAWLILAMLDKGKTLIPCAGVFLIVHAKVMYDHLIYVLSFPIFLGVEGSGFGELGIQQ